MMPDFIVRRRWELFMIASVIITIAVLVTARMGQERATVGQQNVLSVAVHSRTIFDVLARLREVESGQRGYMLTQREDYLVPVARVRLQINALLESLARRYQADGDMEGQALLSQLTTLTGEKLGELELTVAQAREGRMDQALALVNSDMGLQRMTQIESAVQAIVQHNDARLNKLAADSASISNFGLLQVALISALNMALLIIIFTRLKNDFSRKEAEAARLREQREWLNKEVRDRTRQVEQLSLHMQNALEEEKVRLARELHDELGSILTAAKMDVVWVKGKLGGGGHTHENLLEKLQRTIKNIDQGIMVKRRLIEDLRPSTLSSFGLLVAARDLAEESASRNNWELRLDLPDIEPDIDTDTATALYRVIQESLTNASKYAHAQALSVRLACTTEELVLEVADDGKGFDTAGVRPNALGLVGMRQRIEGRGGSFEVITARGHGCRILMNIPLRRTQDDVAAVDPEIIPG